MSFKLSKIQPRAAELAQLSCTLAFSLPGELKVWIELASVRPSVCASVHIFRHEYYYDLKKKLTPGVILTLPCYTHAYYHSSQTSPGLR